MMSKCMMLAALALVAVPAVASAQKDLRLTDQKSKLTVSSALKVPIAVMMSPVARSQSQPAYAFVDAGASATVNKPGSGAYALSKMEPVSWTIMATQQPRCIANPSGKDVGTLVAELRGTLNRLSQQRDVEIEQQAALATQVAAIELAQADDKRNFERYNAYDMEVRRQYFRDNPWGQAYAEQDFNRDVEDFINAFSSMNKMFAAADDAKRSAIANEVSVLEPLAKGADAAKATLRDEYARAEAQARTGGGFVALVANRLNDAKPSIPTEVTVSGTGKRSCPKAAGVEDYVEVTASAKDPRLAVAIGDVSFDKGGSHKTVFRRIKGTNRWIATLYWPTEAGRAQVKMNTGSGWKTVAKIDAGRASMAETRKTAEKNIENVKKRYKTLKFRAEGGDGVKTLIVP